MRYRKKPLVIEAFRLTPDALKDKSKWPGWFAEAWAEGEVFSAGSLPFGEGRCFLVKTLEGTMMATPGDWIIRGTQGEMYPCKPDVFAEVYEAIEEQ